MRIDELLPLLRKVKKTGSGWTACCPSHEDRNPSLSVSQGQDGRILLRCFSGCRAEDICSALGITVSDLFIDDNGRGINHKGRFVSKQTSSRAVSIDFGKLAEQYRAGSDGEIRKAAGGLGVSVESLERLGAGWDGQAITFPMMDSDRRIIGIRRRFPDGRKLAVKESRSGLFIPIDLPESGAVFFAEGPSDCAAVLSMGLAAVGRPSAADGAELVKGFCERAGITAAVIVGDSDEPGKLGAKRLADTLLGVVSDVRIVYPLEPHKDIRAEFQAGKLTAAILSDRAAKAEPIKPSGGNSAISATTSGGITAQNPDDWPELIRLDEPDLPEFPIDKLPAPLADMVLAVAGSLEVPIDMPAMIGLAVGGLCLSKRVIINPRPDWIETPNLYSMIILDPGERKSQTVRLTNEPLEQFEIEENERRAEDVRGSNRRKSILEKRIEKLSVKAAGETDDQARRETENTVHELDKELAELELVYPFRLLTGDCTPEKLATLLFQNDGRIGIITAEDVLSTLTGRQYSSTGESNLSAILSGYSGETIRVDRQGREPIVIRHPAITICLAVQYDVLKCLKRDKSFKGRGLLDRFAYSLPKSQIGGRSIHTTPISGSVKAAYHAAVTRLAQHKPGPDGAEVLKIDSDGTAILNRFRADIEPRLTKDRGDLSGVSGWGSKLPGQVVRIAAILHGYGDPDFYLTKPIGADSMEPAVRIGWYLIEHAKAAFGIMGADEDTELARRVAEWLGNHPEPTTSKRAVFDRFKSSVGTVDGIERPLEILIHHGYLRPIIEQSKGRGRPSERFEIRPGYPEK